MTKRNSVVRRFPKTDCHTVSVTTTTCMHIQVAVLRSAVYLCPSCFYPSVHHADEYSTLKHKAERATLIWSPLTSGLFRCLSWVVDRSETTKLKMPVRR